MCHKNKKGEQNLKNLWGGRIALTYNTEASKFKLSSNVNMNMYVYKNCERIIDNYKEDKS